MTNTIDFALPEFISIPFQNMDWWQGVETTGFIKADASGITVEYQVIHYEASIWTEVKSKSEVGEVTVTLDEIESVKLQEGWLEPMLQIKARSLKPFSDIPGHKQGLIVLCIPSKEKAKAKELVSTLAVRLSEHELSKLRKEED